jgi:hypothetical protein
LSIPALWAQSFEPLVLFQWDFSLGKSCPLWHFFRPHLLNHWLLFKEIFPWGKVVHSGITLGPSFEPHWFVKYKNKCVQTFAWFHWNPSHGVILRAMFCHYVWIAS